MSWRVWVVLVLVNALVVAALVILTSVNHMRLDRTIAVRQRAFPQCASQARQAARRRTRKDAQRHGLSARVIRAHVRHAAKSVDVQTLCGWKDFQSLEVEHILGSSGLFVLLLGLDGLLFLDQRGRGGETDEIPSEPGE